MSASLPTIDLPNDWLARDYQRPFWKWMESGGTRAICVWHRRAGKDQCALNLTAVKSAMRRGSYWHVLPTKVQGREIVWEGMDFGGRPFLEAFPFDYVTRRRDDLMKLWLASGSTWQIVGADDPDKRQIGTNPVGIVFSEYSTTGKMRTLWDYVQPILAENGGWAIFIFTPRGKNHAWKLWKGVQESDNWFTQMLTVDDTWYTDAEGVRKPVVTQEAIEEARIAGMSEAMIRQEFYCDFAGPLEAAFYGDEMARMEEEDRIGDYPWMERNAVDTSFDLGHSDSTVIWFMQKPPAGRTRAIDFYQNRGKHWEHYLEVISQKPYFYRYHIGPHDIRHEHLQTGKSIFEVSRDFGYYFRSAPKLLLRDGIAATRALLRTLEINEVACEAGIQGLREYVRTRSDKLDEYTDMPVHNHASDIADSLRTYATGLPREFEDGGWSQKGALYQRTPIV